MKWTGQYRKRRLTVYGIEAIFSRLASREEFFRLKKIQGKKKRDTEEADALADAAAGGAASSDADGKASGAESGEQRENPDDGIGGGAAGGGDMLDQDKDEDVIF